MMVRTTQGMVPKAMAATSEKKRTKRRAFWRVSFGSFCAVPGLREGAMVPYDTMLFKMFLVS